MPNFTAGTSFSDGVTNDVTAAKLNALVADAVPTSSLSLNSTTGTISLFSSGTGTAATPAIQPTGDTNTGIFFPAADTIAFSEGGAEAMRIDSSGNVGIGTNSPSGYGSTGNTKFVVTGNSRADAWFVGGSSNGAYAYFSNNAQTVVTNALQIGQGWNTGSDNIGFINAIGSNPFLLATNGSERIRIDSSGRVGIGTTSPQEELQINATEPTIRLEESGAGSKRLELSINSSAEAKIFSNQSGGILAFGTVGTERMRIDSSGNVGIGTTSPSSYGIANTSKFVVTGSSRADTWVVGGTSTGAYTFFSNNAQTAPTNAFQIGQGYSSGSDNAGFLLVKAASPLIFGTSDAEQMRINSSGNCSIGTATALSKLHIHGDLTLSNATTAVTASTSTITPPATVAGYLTVSINGTSRKIAYYAT